MSFAVIFCSFDPLKNMRSPLKYFSLGILAIEKTRSLGSELFQYIDCQIPHGDLDPHFNVTGPHYVVGTCCRALRSLDTIPKYGIEHVNFNGLCDQYAYDSHCWSLVEDQFQSHFNYFHDLLDSTNGQGPVIPGRGGPKSPLPEQN